MKIFLILILILFLALALSIYFYKIKKEPFNKSASAINKLHAAVIVEPRKDPLLIPIVLDTIKKLKDTQFYIFHGTENLDFIKEGLSDYINSGKIILINLNKDNITREYYSDMFTSSEFWNQINGENILIFQTDSCICSYPDHSIEDFLDYGFVGAPLEPSDDPNTRSYQNGGFSLRKKSHMLNAISTKKPDENTWPCDEWFSVKKKDIVDVAPYSLGNAFSVERIYYDAPFGIHKPWAFLKSEELDKLKKNCPEIETIFGK